MEEVGFMHILKTLKLAVITALTVGFMFSGSFAYAATLFYQSNSTDESTNVAASTIIQTLGTGLTGTLTDFQFYAKGDGTTDGWSLILVQCNTSGYTGCSTVGTIGWNITTSVKQLIDNPFGSPITLDNTKYYYFQTSRNTGTGNVFIYGCTSTCYANGSATGSGGLADVAFEGYDTETDSTLLGTRIISMTPADGATVSSSTPVTLSGEAYITEEDAGCFLGFGCTFLVFDLMDQNDLLNDNTVLYREQITTGGYFTFSTTTTISEGNYAINGTIYKSLYGTIGTANLLYPRTWNEFVVGTSTWTGSLIQNTTQDITDILAGLTPTSTPIVANSCNPISGFDTIKCISFLFIPSQKSLESISERIHEEILLVAPWGYITRFLDIITSEDRVALPTFTITYPSELEFMGGATLSLNPWPYLMASSSLLGTIESYGSDPKTFREITEDGWNFIVLSIFAITIFFRVMNVDIAMPSGSEISGKVSDFRRRNEGTGGLRNKKRGM